MACLITRIPRIALNKEKNIGRVIYIVEGERTEFSILNRIFTKVFDYSFVEVRRSVNCKPYHRYESKTNKNSIVFVINSEYSCISSITTGKDYLDKIFEVLFYEYQLEPNKAAIYYLFDRDPSSNPSRIIEQLLLTLKNSRDNGEEMNGLLLLSYPKIEAFIISCFEKKCNSLKLPSCKLKQYKNYKKYQNNLIFSKEIINACQEMYKVIKALIKHNFAPNDLDNFGKINTKIYNEQELYYSKNNVYRLLSLLTISMIDLQLIIIE